MLNQELCLSRWLSGSIIKNIKHSNSRVINKWTKSCKGWEAVVPCRGWLSSRERLALRIPEQEQHQGKAELTGHQPSGNKELRKRHWRPNDAREKSGLQEVPDLNSTPPTVCFLAWGSLTPLSCRFLIYETGVIQLLVSKSLEKRMRNGLSKTCPHTYLLNTLRP